MDEVLHARLAAGHGTIRAADLLTAGYASQDIRRLVRDGSLHRVRYGVYVDAARYQAADDHGRHVLEIRAVVRALPQYAASHLSALVWWGLPVLRSDLGPVHVCGIDKGHPRSSPSLQVHRSVSAVDVVQHRGIPVVAAELAVLQTCQLARTASCDRRGRGRAPRPFGMPAGAASTRGLRELGCPGRAGGRSCGSTQRVGRRVVVPPRVRRPRASPAGAAGRDPRRPRPVRGAGRFLRSASVVSSSSSTAPSSTRGPTAARPSSLRSVGKTRCADWATAL